MRLFTRCIAAVLTAAAAAAAAAAAVVVVIVAVVMSCFVVCVCTGASLEIRQCGEVGSKCILRRFLFLANAGDLLPMFFFCGCGAVHIVNLWEHRRRAPSVHLPYCVSDQNASLSVVRNLLNTRDFP